MVRWLMQAGACAVVVLGAWGSPALSDDNAPVRIYDVIEVSPDGGQTSIGVLTVDLGARTATLELGDGTICGPSDYTRNGWSGEFEACLVTFSIEAPLCLEGPFFWEWGSQSGYLERID